MKNNRVIKEIKNIIKGTEFENNTYIAGGFVRDYIMKRETNDIDIAVSIENGGILLAKYISHNLNLNNPVIYENYGTAMIQIFGHEVEFVATRKEIYNFNNRKPEVSFGAIHDDVLRRDLTINSILYDISNDKIIDYVNGEQDIIDKIIRTTGNPDVIFAEDPLRIMRAIRFATQLNFKIDGGVWEQIKDYVGWLKNISKERIRDEFVKIIISDNVERGMNLLFDSGILEFILPVFKDVKEIKRQGKYHTKDLRGHIIEVMTNIEPNVEHRLAALLHDIGKPKTMVKHDNGDITFYNHQRVSKKLSESFLREYKFPNEVIKKVIIGVENHMSFSDFFSVKAVRRFVSKIGKENLLFCLDLAEADAKTQKRIDVINDIKDIINNDEYIVKDKFNDLPVNGNDIMETLNINTGKRVGEILNKVKDLVIDKPNITKEEILEIIKGW